MKEKCLLKEHMDIKKLASNLEDEINKYMTKGLRERHEALVKMSVAFEWDKYIAIIPEITFPDGWRIQIIPPYAGAIIRFRAFFNDKEISVYLDGFNILGYYKCENDKESVPYWEAYPIDGDTFRCNMKDVDELINAMKEEFKGDNEHKEISD